MVPYFTRLKFAFRTFCSILDHSRIPDDVAAALQPERPVTPVAAPPPTPAAVPAAAAASPGAVHLLALLQRDGRLVDFLMEDLSAYSDSQIGAAVRDVHAGCRAAIDRYFTLRPVMHDEEGRPVTVERGVDPASVKVVGHVTGAPPFRGLLRHRGWEAARVELPPLPSTEPRIIAPAEVEVS